jgi:hypothetical protein
MRVRSEWINGSKRMQAMACGVLLCGMAATMAAQEAVSATGTGTVTGHVTFGDTQRPARFATVVLYGVPAEVSMAPKIDPDADEAAQMKALTAAFGSIGKTNMVQAETGIDGSYEATDVAPGDYYVFGSAAGYVSPLNQVEAAFGAGADLKKPLPGVQVIHVVADHPSTADVSLARGAAVSGVISWDDGSPVTGAMLAVTPVKGEAKPPQQFSMLAMSGNMLSLLAVSDDTGHFRISGLAAGEYILQASIKTGGQMGLGTSMNFKKLMAGATPLVVYAPSAFHKADAKSITLHDGEDLREQMLTLNLGGLHSVRGRVASAEDHHGVNSATVRLQDGTDKDFVRTASVDAAGNYTVTFVPPGTYTLKVSDAEDTEPKPKSDKASDKDKLNLFGSGDKTIRSYEDGKTSVIVTDSDVTAPDVELAPAKGEKPDPADALKKMLDSTN